LNQQIAQTQQQLQKEIENHDRTKKELNLLQKSSKKTMPNLNKSISNLATQLSSLVGEEEVITLNLIPNKDEMDIDDGSSHLGDTQPLEEIEEAIKANPKSNYFYKGGTMIRTAKEGNVFLKERGGIVLTNIHPKFSLRVR